MLQLLHCLRTRSIKLSYTFLIYAVSQKKTKPISFLEMLSETLANLNAFRTQ